MNKAKPQAVPVDIRAVYQDTKARYPVTWAMLAADSVDFGSLVAGRGHYSPRDDHCTAK